MKTWIFVTGLFVSMNFANPACFADEEHSDVEFAYVDGRIEIEFGDEGAVFEGEFPTTGVDLQVTTEPGFGSEVEEGAGIEAGDQIAYNVLSDLMYWNEGFQPVPKDAQIRIVNRPPSPVVPDTIVGVGTGIQRGSFEPPLNRIGAAEGDGDFHSDLDLILEPKTEMADAAMLGAYGFVMSLSSDEGGTADSEPFAVVFNFGLEDERFEAGVGQFAKVVPEPTGLIPCMLTLCWAMRLHRGRRR